MSTHVVGFVPPDDRWHKMKAAWDACTAAGVRLPIEVGEFFGHALPDAAGVELKIDAAVTPFIAAERHGFDVALDKLPPNVKVVRFFNSF